MSDPTNIDDEDTDFDLSASRDDFGSEDFADSEDLDFGEEKETSLQDLSNENSENTFSDLNDNQVMEESILIHDGKKYAVGLFWLVADELAGPSLAKKRAKMAKSDFYCIRDSVIVQHGFGSLKQGHKMGMPVAAAETADMLVGEWHAIFKAENGWWYLAVHGDAIAPEGDKFFTDEEAAYNFFMEQCNSYKWPRIYAPADWDIPNATAELFLERILDQGPSTNLKPVTLDALFAGRRNKFIAGIGLLILLGIVFLVSLLPAFILSNLQEPPPIMSMAELNIGEVKAPPKAKEIEVVVEGISTLKIPRPSTVIAACGESISRVIRPLPGWEIARVNCDGAQATVRWRQNGGSLALLLRNTGVFPKGSIARFESNEFVVSVPVPDTSIFVQETNPIENRSAQLILNNRLSSAGTLQMQYIQPPAPPVKTTLGIRETEQPKAPPPYLNVNFETTTAPQAIAAYFDMQGLEIKMVEWRFTEGTWAYHAKVNLEEG